MKLLSGALVLFFLSLPCQSKQTDASEAAVTVTPVIQISPVSADSLLSDPVSVSPSVPPESDVAIITQFELADGAVIDSPIRLLLKQYLSVLIYPAEPMSEAARSLKQFSVLRELRNLLATEGYFSPQISFVPHAGPRHILVTIEVQAGLRTRVGSVQFNFAGATAPAELQQAVRVHWSLPAGAAFRDEDWTRAKNNLLEIAIDAGYPAAKLIDSEARIDGQQAILSLVLDCGPSFFIGDLQIDGLSRYPAWLVERYHPPVKGERYSRDRLLRFQRELQNSP